MMKKIKETPVTMVLLGLTTIVFLAMQLVFFGQATSAYAVFATGGMFGEVIKQFPSQSWRLISPIFIHIGWEHFIFNALTLYFVGPLAERLFGSARFLALYMLSGLMGNLFTLFFRPSVVAAGASTSLFGVLASIAVLGYFGSNFYLQQLGRSYQMLIVLNLIFNLFSPNIGITGHLGGAVGGILCAVILPNMVEKNIFDHSMKLKALLGYIGLAVLFFGLAMLI